MLSIAVFPPEVQAVVKHEGDTMLHKYLVSGHEMYVVHAAAPNLKAETIRDNAVGKLEPAFKNMLIQWAKAPVNTVRILPLASELFAPPDGSPLKIQFPRSSLSPGFGPGTHLIPQMKRRSHLKRSTCASTERKITTALRKLLRMYRLLSQLTGQSQMR